MTNTNKILIGVGGLAVLGVGIYLVTRKGKTTTTTTTTVGDNQVQDPSTTAVGSWVTSVGNLFSDIFGEKKKQEEGKTCTAPANPYLYDGIKESDYNSDQIKTMQSKLSDLDPEIKDVIDSSGGVDGIIGPGFVNAYNMARKSCKITSISNIT